MFHPKYRPDIDGLRAVAVISVVIYHAFPSLIKGGFIGVDIFFVISGYLISTIIFKSLDQGTFSLLEFYKRRAKRILPSLFIVLITCLLFGWFVLLADEFNQLAKHVLGGSTFVSNLILWGESGYFDASSETKPLLHLWSLGIEEQFYIFWPIILLVIRPKKFGLISTILVVLALSFSYSYWTSKVDPVAAFYSPLARSWELMFGCVIAWLNVYKSRIGKFNLPAISNNFISLLGFSMITYGFLEIDKDTSGFPGIWALLPVIGTSIIIFSGPDSFLNKTILSHKALIQIGLISYPLYLWHWPILTYLRVINSNEPPHYIVRVLAVIASVIIAWLTVEIVEKPIRNSTEPLNSAFLSMLILGIPILGSTGFYFMNKDIYSSHNFETRLVKRSNFEHGIGYSLKWFKGKEDWLFLGNAYDNTIAKLKGALVPSKSEIISLRDKFTDIARTSAKYNTKVVLFIGPDKPTIYPEYLPEEVKPNSIRYLDFYLKELNTIANLTVYDPTVILRSAKSPHNLLYWKSDTHWNQKGALVAFQGFTQLLNIPDSKVNFVSRKSRKGDLIDMSQNQNLSYQTDYCYKIVFNNTQLDRAKLPCKIMEFGEIEEVTNNNAPDNRYVWIVGDSYSSLLRDYFNNTFKKVRYVGHWVDNLHTLPKELDAADNKPDLIVIEKVERSF